MAIALDDSNYCVDHQLRLIKREPTAAPSLTFEIGFIAALLVIALGVSLVGKDIDDTFESNNPVQAREIEAARRYAAIVAACLNGKTITEGERVVDCKVRP